MADDTRREFLKTAGIAAAAAAVGAAVSAPAEAADTALLPKEQFEKFFGDVLALISDPNEANTTVADVLARHHLTPRLPVEAERAVRPLMMRSRRGAKVMYTGNCPSCSVCCVCNVCGSGDALSGVAGAAAVTDFF